MAFSLTGKKDDTPIAITIPEGKAKEPEIIYQSPEDLDAPPQTPAGVLDTVEGVITCPNCHKTFKSKVGAKYHFAHVCHIRTTCHLRLETSDPIEPTPTAKRQVIAIMGSMGSGKSYRVARFVRAFLRVWPDRRVFLFTTHDEPDPTYAEAGAEWDKLTVIRPTIGLIVDRFKLTDFQDALVIFDDVSSSRYSNAEDPRQSRMENRAIREYLTELAVDLAENARHVNSPLIITSHALYTGQKGDIMSVLLRDATDCIIFPQQTGHSHVQYFLRHHIGMVGAQASQILALPSRWVLIHKAAPKYFMWSHGVERYDVLC